MACLEQNMNTTPPVNTALRKRRCRPIGPATWSSLAAFMARERACLSAARPNSVRIRPTLAPVASLQREPGMAATEMRRAA